MSQHTNNKKISQLVATRLLPVVRGLSNDKNPKLTGTRNKNRLPGLITLTPLQKTRYTMSKYMNKTMVQSNTVNTDTEGEGA